MNRLFLSLLLMPPSLINAQNWSFLHKKIFTQKEHQAARASHKLTFESPTITPFTWLIFSWNAERPTAGYFTFFVQVHNVKTNKWTPLYKAAEWGRGKQLSFVNNTNDPRDKDSQYLHVRLEMINDSSADKFRIYCVPTGNADLSLVKMMAANTMDARKFKPETLTKSYKSTYIKDVPFKSQFLIKHPDFSVLCSPTATSLLVQYLTKTPQDPASFADNVYDTSMQAYGSWPFNIAHAYTQAQGAYWFYFKRLNSWDELYALIKKIPVVVSVRGVLPGAPKEFPGGHLLLVVGYDATTQRVLCHDSSALFRYFDKEKNKMICPDLSLLDETEAIRSYDLNDFLAAWEKSFRSAYVADPSAGSRRAGRGVPNT